MANTTLTPSFHLKFGHAILPNTVVVGKFDGRNPSMVAATTGGRLLLHTPHELLDDSVSGATQASGRPAPINAWGSAPLPTTNPIRFFNINKDVTSLAAGTLGAFAPMQKDILLVGTSNSIQAYDVLENKDLFFRDVPDTVSALAIGSWSVASPAMAVAGGNCSVQGFDATGNDIYWTVTGDVVTSMCFGNITGQGKMELLVGSADFDIRCYRGEDVVSEVTETDNITALHVPCAGHFAYALANGTVGVYSGSTFTRLWRVKSKSKAVAITTFDIDGDGTDELICAFANGRFEARRVLTGDLVYRDSLGGQIAGLLVSEYRNDGKPLLLVVGTDGEVRGYAQSDVETLARIRAAVQASLPSAEAKAKDGLASPSTKSAAPVVKDAATAFSSSSLPEKDDISELLTERAKLDAELRTLEQLNAGGTSSKGVKLPGSMPANSDIVISLDFHPSAHRIEMVVVSHCNGGAGAGAGEPPALRAVALYALDAGIFGADKESYVVVQPPTASDVRVLRVPLSLVNNVATELRVQAIVGQHHSSAYYGVIEKPYRLPKFAMFQPLNGVPALAASIPTPEGGVSFTLKERAHRLVTWLSKSFPLKADQLMVSASASPALDAQFLNMRTGSMVRFTVATEHGGQLTIACDDIQLCGELVQDMATYMSLSELETTAHFPMAFADFRKTLQKMEEFTAIRNRLTGDSAVASASVKTLVIQAEDARILADMKSMRRHYGELRTVHEELLGEYAKRAANHAALITTLKDVNQMIQWCANLRVGEAKSRVIAACRHCLKANNPHGMIPIMQSGKTT